MHDLPTLGRSRIGAGITTAVPITLLAVWTEINLAGTRLAELDVGVNASANSFGLVVVAFPLLCVVNLLVFGFALPWLLNGGFEAAHHVSRFKALVGILVGLALGTALVSAVVAVCTAITVGAMTPDDHPTPSGT